MQKLRHCYPVLLLTTASLVVAYLLFNSSIRLNTFRSHGDLTLEYRQDCLPPNSLAIRGSPEKTVEAFGGKVHITILHEKGKTIFGTYLLPGGSSISNTSQFHAQHLRQRSNLKAMALNFLQARPLLDKRCIFVYGPLNSENIGVVSRIKRQAKGLLDQML